MNESKFSPAVINGIALIIGASIFGSFYYSAQTTVSTKDILSVTGSAKTRVTADQAKLIIAFSRVVFVSNLSSGYNNIANDLSSTRNLLKKEGIPDSDVIENPVSMYQVYDQNYSTDLRYQLNQTITVSSNDISKITGISKKIPSLAAQGAVVSVQSLEYYYSKLPDLRVSLLTEAIKDAKARAEKIAEGTGRRIGNVQAASSGVVQVLSPNSVDVADYGSYDTSSIEKDVMVIVKASFRLR